MKHLLLLCFTAIFFHLSGTGSIEEWATYQSKSGRRERGELLKLAQSYQKVLEASSNHICLVTYPSGSSEILCLNSFPFPL